MALISKSPQSDLVVFSMSYWDYENITNAAQTALFYIINPKLITEVCSLFLIGFVHLSRSLCCI